MQFVLPSDVICGNSGLNPLPSVRVSFLACQGQPIYRSRLNKNLKNTFFDGSTIFDRYHTILYLIYILHLMDESLHILNTSPICAAF